MRIQNVEGMYTIPENLSLHSVRTEGIIVECNTANDQVRIILPPLTAYPNVKNLRVIVVDASGDAETNNITVELAQDETSTTIDGELSWTIDNASDAVVFSRVTEDDWTASKQVITLPNIPEVIDYNQAYGQIRVQMGVNLLSFQRNDFGGAPSVTNPATGIYEVSFSGNPFADADKVDLQHGNPFPDEMVVGRIKDANTIVFEVYYLATNALVNIVNESRLRFHVSIIE